jgi:hypothetical protein
MIFAVAFIDYDGNNELVLERVDANSECEAMANVLDAQYFDTADFEVAVADNDVDLFQETIDDLGLNIEIQALAIDD